MVPAYHATYRYRPNPFEPIEQGQRRMWRDDMATLDALRPTMIRLERLHERMTDTHMALGSDLMTNALEGYAVLKVAGKGEGLDSLRRMLSARFNRSRAEAVEEAVPAG